MIADIATRSTNPHLTVGALSVRNTSLSRGINAEASKAGSTLRYSARTLGAVRVTSHTPTVDNSEAVLAAGHAVSVGDDT